MPSVKLGFKNGETLNFDTKYQRAIVDSGTSFVLMPSSDFYFFKINIESKIGQKIKKQNNYKFIECTMEQY